MEVVCGVDSCSSAVKRGKPQGEMKSFSDFSVSSVTFLLETTDLEEAEAKVREPCHSADACFLCKRPLRRFFDVFMYKGNTPFCSDDCRQEQIDRDDAEEREARYHRSMRHPRATTAEEAALAVDLASLRPALAAEAIAAS